MLLFSWLVFLLFVFGPAAANDKGLKVGSYEKTCPQAEAIVEKTMAKTVSVAASLAAALLRIHFHGCFVRVCI